VLTDAAGEEVAEKGFGGGGFGEGHGNESARNP
jgi:hypothetical protein